MNTYVILACSDVVHKIFDIYIDTVEAWTAHEAIEKFRDLHFALKNKNFYVRGGELHTNTTAFRAFPIVLDTENRFRYIYWIDGSGEKLTTENTVKQYLRKEKKSND